MESLGYIKLYRKFLEWEWYDDDNCTRLFIHCLLKANYRDKQWRGKTILRGQFFTSVDTLSKELHLTTKQIRIAISKLENTGEILKKGANEGTYITVCNYDNYQQTEQAEGQTEGKQGANEGQTKGERGATTNNNKNSKEIEEDNDITQLHSQFEIFRQMYPGSKRGFDPELENLKKAHKDWRQIIPILSDSLQYQIRAREELNRNGGFVPSWKNLKTWINQKCWTEEINISNIDGTHKKVGVTDGELAELYAQKFGVDSPQRRY